MLNAKLIPFYLAQEALNDETMHHQQFAISTLFDILKNKEVVEILKKEENFYINQDFYKIVAKNPLETLNELKNKKPFVKRFIKDFGKKLKKIL